MEKSITVEIDKAGNIKMEAHGFKGEGCVEATKKLLEKMGTASTTTEYKPEYYETESVRNTQQIGGG